MKKRIRNFLFPAATMLVVLFAAGCRADQKTSQPDTDSAIHETKSNNFNVETLSGIELNFANYLSQSELTAVHVWETSCTDCEDEMKILGEVSREYAGKGVQIAGAIRNINSSDTAEAQAITDAAGIDYIQLLYSSDLKKNYPDNEITLPVTLFIDRSGQLLGTEENVGKTVEQWEDTIEKYHKTVCIGDHPAERGVG